MRKTAFLLLLAVLLTGGCALHISGLQDEQGRQTLYTFANEHTAFASAYEAIVSVIPDAPVKAVSGAMRGYSVAEQNLITGGDESAFTISILPGTATDSAGKKVFGYYTEVSVNDEALSGRLTAKKIYRAIVENFERDGQPLQVDHIKLGQYQGGAFLRGGHERVNDNGDIVGASLAEELTALHELRLKGGLSREEYEELKERLMGE